MQNEPNLRRVGPPGPVDRAKQTKSPAVPRGANRRGIGAIMRNKPKLGQAGTSGGPAHRELIMKNKANSRRGWCTNKPNWGPPIAPNKANCRPWRVGQSRRGVGAIVRNKPKPGKVGASGGRNAGEPICRTNPIPRRSRVGRGANARNKPNLPGAAMQNKANSRQVVVVQTNPISGGRDTHYSSIPSFHHSRPMPVVPNKAKGCQLGTWHVAVWISGPKTQVPPGGGLSRRRTGTKCAKRTQFRSSFRLEASSVKSGRPGGCCDAGTSRQPRAPREPAFRLLRLDKYGWDVSLHG
jgi:hypothetical protein